MRPAIADSLRHLPHAPPQRVRRSAHVADRSPSPQAARWRPREIERDGTVGTGVDGFPEIFDVAAAPLSALEESRVRGLMTAQRAEEARSRPLANRARQYLEPVFRAAPDDYEVADRLAVCRFLERDEDSAIALWIKLLQGSPVHEQTLQSLVSAFRKRGRDVEALGYLDRLVEVNPWQARFWEQRSHVQSSLGRREEALGSGASALELDPSLRELYRPLAELARSLGNKAQAERLERRVERFKPAE